MSNLSDVTGGANLYGGWSYSFAYDRFCNINSAIYFNGGYLKVPPGVYFSGDLTVIAWVYLKQNISLNSRIIDFSNGNYSDNVCMVMNSYFSTTIRLNSTIGSGLSTSSPLVTNQWYHFAFTLNGTNGIIYINGTLVKTSSSFLVPRGVNRTVNFIGNVSPNSTYDDIKIYHGALSAAQILNDYIVTSNNGTYIYMFVFFCMYSFS